MADDNVVKTTIDLDNAAFISKMEESLGILDKFGVEGTSSMSGLIEKIGMIGEIVAPVAVALLAIKETIDLVETAEKLDQIQKTFDLFAQDVGLVADDLKDKIVASAAGLATESEVLQASSKAMAILGDNAKHLPEIMELARKQTAVMGGDFFTNFNNMARAMENGNQRMLLNMGITVNATKAHQEYAKELGVGIQYLDQAGQKQAVFNAALESAREKFRGVDVEATPVTNNLKRMSTAFSEMKEDVAKSMSEMFAPLIRMLTGPTSLRILIELLQDVVMALRIFQVGFQAIFTTLVGFADIIKGVGDGFAFLGKGIWATVTGNEALKKSLEDATKAGKGLGTIDFTATQKNYDNMVKTIMAKPIFDDVLKKLDETDSKVAKQEAISANRKHIDNEKLKSDEIKLQAEILKIKEQALKDSEKTATDAETFKKIRALEEENIAKDAANKIHKLDVDGVQKGLLSQEEFASAKKQIEAKSLADIQILRNKSHQDELTALKNLRAQNELTSKGFATAWAQHGKEAELSFKNFATLGDTAFGAVKNHAVSAFKSIGDGSKSAADALRGAMFGAIGDIASAQGEELLAWGIGSMDPVAAAEGAALIALGSALSSMGTGSKSVSGGGGGGGVASSPAQDNSLGQPQTAGQQKNLQLVVHGNIFETDQTRTRLMDMIRQSGDFTDFNLKQIGQQ